MKMMKFKNWLGLFLIVVSTSIAITAKMYQNQPNITIWMYVTTIVLFAIGGPLALDLSFKSLFYRKSSRPNYEYQPEHRRILVYFDSAPFMIERDGVKIRLVMTLGVPTQDKFMFVCEPEVGLDFAFRATGVDGDRELTLCNGSKLHFVRQEHTFIKVWWSEVKKPWKFVGEE